MERIKKFLEKSDDLLDEEMDRGQGIAEDLMCLKSQYDELEIRHVALSVAHEAVL